MNQIIEYLLILYGLFSLLFAGEFGNLYIGDDDEMYISRVKFPFIEWYKDKNIFGYIYVTIAIIICFPSYLMSILLFSFVKVILFIYNLGNKR